MRILASATLAIVFSAVAVGAEPTMKKHEPPPANTPGSGPLGRVKKLFGGFEENETLSAEAPDFLISDVAEPTKATETTTDPSDVASEIPPMAIDGDSPTMEMPADGTVVTSSPVQYISGTNRSRNWYGRVDWIYWDTTDPNRIGTLWNVVQNTAVNGIPVTNPSTTGTIVNNIALQNNETVYEMGFRTWIGKHLSDDFAIEAGGLWDHPSDRITTDQRTANTGLAGTGATVNSVRYVRTRELFDIATMSYRSRFWGAEMNGRWHLWEGDFVSIDALAGARYFAYYERIAFQYRAENDTTTYTERFNADNNLIGGQLGWDFNLALLEYLTSQMAFRFGMMGNVQDVAPSASPTADRFIAASNAGGFNQCEFSPLVEFTPSMVLELTPNITVQGGYTFIWIDNLIRANNQVDQLNSFPGGSPMLDTKSEAIWIHGFTIGLTANW